MKLASRAATITTAAGLALTAAAAHGQVTSTWTNQGGDSIWTNPENWNHSNPNADGNFPDNGRDGFNYHAKIDLAANVAMNQEITLDALTLSGFNRFISGASQLRVLGSSIVEGTAGFGGGGGQFFADGGVTVRSGEFHLRDWDLDTDSINLGEGGTRGSMRLFETANATVDGVLAFFNDGSLSGEPGTTVTVVNGAILRQTGTPNSVVGINVPLRLEGGTISSNVGEIRFGPVFGFPVDQPSLVLDNATILVERTDASVRFDNIRMAVNGDLTVESEGPFTVQFKDADVQLDGSMTGPGAVLFTGQGSRLHGDATLALSRGGFIHSGGDIATATNRRLYQWRSGRIYDGTFTNAANGATAENQNGPRVVQNGELQNQSLFQHMDGTITLAPEGVIRNSGVWVSTSASAIDRQIPNDETSLFFNLELFQMVAPNIHIVTTIDVPFENSGTVESRSGGLVFRRGVALDFDYQTLELTKGTWRAVADGTITFLRPSGGTRLKHTIVEVNGLRAAFDLLDDLTENRGTVSIRGGKQQEVSPHDGPFLNHAGAMLHLLGNGLGPRSPTMVSLPHMVNQGTVIVSETAILSATEWVDFRGGVLHGRGGSVASPMILNSAGTVAPGSPPEGEPFGEQDTTGTLTLDGDYEQQTAGRLAIEIGGTQTGEFDVLAVTGAATLAGTLEILALDTYTPARGDAFDVLPAGSVAGAFDTVEAPEPGTGLRYHVQYHAGGVRVRVVCRADLNGDDTVNTLDFLAFLNAFTGEDQLADWNGDGDINTLDFVAYLNDFTGDC